MKKTIIFTLLILTAFFIGCDIEKDTNETNISTTYSFSSDEINLFNSFTNEFISDLENIPMQIYSKTEPYLLFKAVFTDYITEDDEVIWVKGDTVEIIVEKIDTQYHLLITKNSITLEELTNDSVENLLKDFYITSSDLKYIDSYVSSLEKKYFKVEKNIDLLDSYNYKFTLTVYLSESKSQSFSFELEKLNRNKYSIYHSGNKYIYENIKNIFDNVNWYEVKFTPSFTTDHMFLKIKEIESTDFRYIPINESILLDGNKNWILSGYWIDDSNIKHVIENYYLNLTSYESDNKNKIQYLIGDNDTIYPSPIFN